MLEARGNLWDFDGVHAITTNGFVKRNGECVMGRGCASEAKNRWPRLAHQLGEKIREEGNIPFFFPVYTLVSFPVKHNWWEVADLDLIARSAHSLESLIFDWELTMVYLPRPGCGNGHLSWDVVKPVLEPILSDRVTVVTF